MDPTEAELAAINTVDEAANWIGLHGAPGDAATERGSLFLLLGLQAAQHVRLIAMMSEVDYDTLIATWMPGGAAPTPAQTS